MPWCPRCKAEYREGFDICSDCKCKLVPELKIKDSETHDVDTPAFLTTADNDVYADIIESKLKSFGIPVIKRHREAGGYMKVLMGSTIFGVDLLVPSRLLDDAKKIVAREMPHSLAETEDKEMGGSVQRKRRARARIILLFLAPGILTAIVLLILFYLFR